MTFSAPYPQVPLTLLAPTSLDSLAPLEIHDPTSGVHAAIVERYAIENLPLHWRTTCGFYLLFSPIAGDNSFDAYVGKASNGFHRRLSSHHETKDYWRSAILIRKDGLTGFTSTQSAWLEGRMRDILDLSPHVNVRNIAATGDATLPEWEKGIMEAVILSTLRIMFLRGYRNASMGAFADKLTTKIADYPPATQETGSTITYASPNPPDPTVATAPISGGEKFALLKAWRLNEAKKASVPPYIIFKDMTLNELISTNPTTMEDLVKVPGIGNKKAELYGQALLSIISSPLL